MHKAVELILKRMESHPEEFMDTRFKQRIEPYRQYLNTEEKEALKTKEREIHLDMLHVMMMKHILADKEPTDKDDPELVKRVGGQVFPSQGVQNQIGRLGQTHPAQNQIGTFGQTHPAQNQIGKLGQAQMPNVPDWYMSLGQSLQAHTMNSAPAMPTSTSTSTVFIGNKND